MFLYDIKINNRKKRRIIHRDSKKIRRSLNKILIAKSEIKHTNNRSTINIYTLNNEKKILKNKLFRLNLGKKNSSLYKFFNAPQNKYSNVIIKQIKKYNLMLKNRVLLLTLRKRVLFAKKNYLIHLNKFKGNKRKINLYKLKKYSSGRFSNYKDKLILTILRKRSYIKNIFFFSFLKWALFLFKIEVKVFSSNKTKTLTIKKMNSKTNILFKAFMIRKNFVNRIGLINNLLLSLLINNFNDSIKNRVIVSLFSFFKNKYYLKYLKLRLKRETVSLMRLNLLNFNNIKFKQLIPKLSLMLNNILNNKIEFNIINLKYLHMNTDIFTQAIAVKLRRKTSRLLLILKRSLRLIKMPKRVNSINDVITTNKTNFVKNYSTNDKYKDFSINSFKSKLNKNDNKKDLLNFVVNNIFFKSKKNIRTIKSRFNVNILNTIQHKWTKGIRLEVKGRLTKRYTASRAIFKYIYLGNLRDYNNYNMSKYSMTRGDNKSNLQYSFTPSKKRIGSFGVKGWISTK